CLSIWRVVRRHHMLIPWSRPTIPSERASALLLLNLQGRHVSRECEVFGHVSLSYFPCSLLSLARIHALLPSLLTRGVCYRCGGWDLNPRTPTGQGPEPCAFDLAWQPPLGGRSAKVVR